MWTEAPFGVAKPSVQPPCVRTQDICAILCGLVIAQDYRRGQRMLTDRNFKDNAQFFQVRRRTGCCVVLL